MRALIILALFSLSATATAAEEKGLSGSWYKQADGFELKLIFLKDNKLKGYVGNGLIGCNIEAKYTAEKDGTLKCEITKYETFGVFPQKEKGYKFSLQFKAKGKTAKLSNFEGEGIDDEGKAIIEGNYEKTAK